MDKNTCMYMENRVKAYNDLERSKENLEKCKVEIFKSYGFEIRTNCCTRSFRTKSELRLKEAIANSIDECIAEIEKEMEEI